MPTRAGADTGDPLLIGPNTTPAVQPPAPKKAEILHGSYIRALQGLNIVVPILP